MLKKKIVNLAVTLSLVATPFAGITAFENSVVEAKTVSEQYSVTDNLNVRAGSGTKYKLLGTLKKGTTVIVTEKTSNGWYKISYKGKVGYVSGKYLKKVTTTVKKTATTNKVSGVYEVITNGLNVRAGSGTQYKSLGTLKNGTQISVTGKTSNDWYKFSYKGKTGYVSGKYIKKITSKVVKTSSSVELKVPFYDQYEAKAPMGCEASSLLQALHFKDKATNYNLATFLKKMPVDSKGDPNKGFGGTPYKVVKGVYQSIYPKALAKWGSKYGTVVDISGASVTTLKKELDKGNPIVVYITNNYEAPKYQKYFWGTGIDNAHVVTLSGYKKGYYHVTDPAKGAMWVSAKKFEYAYNLKKFAVVVR